MDVKEIQKLISENRRPLLEKYTVLHKGLKGIDQEVLFKTQQAIKTAEPTYKKLQDLGREIEKIQSSIKHVDIFGSQFISSANMHFGNIFRATFGNEDVLKAISKANTTFSHFHRELTKNMAIISTAGIFTQTTALRIQEKLNAQSGVYFDLINDLSTKTLGPFASAYHDLGAYLDESLKDVGSVHPIYWERAPLEIYQAYRSAEKLLEINDLPEEENSYDSTYSIGHEEIVNKLDKVNPLLKDMYLGMINVSDNQGPDASRHFSSSARELMINLIKTLVPKKDFQLWCEDNNLIKEDGNPTFYGSLQYICRKINHDPIKEFIHLDLRALNKLFKALNSEVHEKKSLLTEIQMSALLSRIGGSILYLIDIDNQN